MTDTPAAPADLYSPPENPGSLVDPISPISGFWRRLGAFVIDAIIIGVVGFVIGMLAIDVLARMGWLARAVGFLIALAYAGILNSRIAGGQTIGKRLLGIRVTRLDGSLLPLPIAVARQVVFSVPFFLNGAPFSANTMASMWAMIPLALVVFGGMFSIIYLFAFNRRNRRSLHDLAVGSVVVRAPLPVPALSVPPVWRGHFVVAGIFALLALIAPFAGQQLLKTETFDGMMPLYEAMSAEPGVLQVQVNVGSTFGAGEDTTYVAVTLHRDSPEIEDEAYARAVARKVLRAYPKAAQADAINVKLVYGFDMVIASGWRSYSYSFKPADLDTE